MRLFANVQHGVGAGWAWRKENADWAWAETKVRSVRVATRFSVDCAPVCEQNKIHFF